MSKAIATKYHPWTATRGARFSASDEDGNRVFIGADSVEERTDSEAAHRVAAEALKAKMGWTGALVGGGTASGWVFVFVERSDLVVSLVEAVQQLLEAYAPNAERSAAEGGEGCLHSSVQRGRAALRLLKGEQPAKPEGVQVIGFLNAYHSRPDFAGNRYYAFRYTEAATGKQVEGTCGALTGADNIRLLMYYWHGGSHEPRDIIFNDEEMPIRQYDRMIKQWEYVGSNPETMVEFIRKRLAAQ